MMMTKVKQRVKKEYRVLKFSNQRNGQPLNPLVATAPFAENRSLNVLRTGQNGHLLVALDTLLANT
jgi:hypothetical protein